MWPSSMRAITASTWFGCTTGLYAMPVQLTWSSPRLGSLSVILIERRIDAARIGAAEHEPRKIAADEWGCIGVVRFGLLPQGLRVETGETEQCRHDVDMACQARDIARCWETARIGDDHRHPHDLLIHLIPFLVRIAVRPRRSPRSDVKTTIVSSRPRERCSASSTLRITRPVRSVLA